MQDKRIDDTGPLETPQWRGGIVGGVWQSVRLVATGETLVKDVFIEPKIADDSVTFETQDMPELLSLCEAGCTDQSWDLQCGRFAHMLEPQHNGTLREEWWLGGSGRNGRFVPRPSGRSDAQTESAFFPGLFTPQRPQR